MEVPNIKCGKIFILSTDYFSLICDCCAGDFFTLEDLHEHLNDHLPKLPIRKIKIEDSSDSDSKSVPLEKQNDTKDNFSDNEHSSKIQPSTGIEESNISDCESIPPDIQAYMMDFKDVIKYEVSSESFNEASSSKLDKNQNKDTIIQSVKLEIKQPKQTHELHQSNFENEDTANPKDNKVTHSSRFPKRLRNGITASMNEISETDDNESNNSSQKPCLLPKKNGKRTRGRVKGEFPCRFCGKKLNGNRDRDEHENTHTGNRPYVCQICSKTFTSSSNLRGHLKWHDNDRKFQCSLCERAFVRKRRLNDHIRENHLPDTDPRRYFPCQICNAKCKSVASLQIHRRTHRQDSKKQAENFVCDCCKKQFKTKRGVIDHMVVHSHQKPYKCKHCNKKFAYRSENYKHQKNCLNKISG